MWFISLRQLIQRFSILNTSILIFIFGACHSPGFSKVAAGFDTLQIQPYDVLASPSIFEKAFFKGAFSVTEDRDSVHFFQLNIGNINIETGKIIAADVVTQYDMPPFTQNFPIGRFPVLLSVARLRNNDERIAFSQIVFPQDTITHWEYALHGNQKPASIFSDTLYSYGVDAGVGLFIDEKSNNAFKKLSDNIADLMQKYIFKGLNDQTHTSWQYNIQSFPGGNLAAFSTGWGDGHYATYIGFNKNEKPCRLLTDFALINWWKNE
ncbi:hypothetical protein DC498_04330 [Terrimonas sp.]|nr:hypothetical protein DC498_04330 [Terrimonas sp.]